MRQEYKERLRSGAPLEVEMAGRCSACRVKVQRGGDFDWVLAKVQQDEAYRP